MGLSMNSLPNVYCTEVGSIGVLKKRIPVSLGTKNISLEKGNRVPGRSRTVFRYIGGSLCCLVKITCNVE